MVSAFSVDDDDDEREQRTRVEAEIRNREVSGKGVSRWCQGKTADTLIQPDNLLLTSYFQDFRIILVAGLRSPHTNLSRHYFLSLQRQAAHAARAVTHRADLLVA